MLKRFLQRKTKETPDRAEARAEPAPNADTTVYRLTIRPSGDTAAESAAQTIDAPEHKTLLDAALDVDVLFPHNCCSGDCGTCLCRVVSGEVEELMDTGHLIDEDEQAEGWILGCQTLPRSDVEIEIPDV